MAKKSKTQKVSTKAMVASATNGPVGYKITGSPGGAFMTYMHRDGMGPANGLGSADCAKP
jgi:hypothetical protein